MIIQSARPRLPVLVASLAGLVGIGTAVHYYRLGLTLSHYDSRGHLIVARRILDSITPGWIQIGAVWLPLPHLLNAIPVQIDAFYRSGGSAVAISIAAYVLAAASIWTIVQTLTGSKPASWAAAAIFALNPNVLYLQSTPMTEPLLLGLTTFGIARLLQTVRQADPDCDLMALWRTGGVLSLACLTRYEAWPVTASAVLALVWTRLRAGAPRRAIVREATAVVILPICALLGFSAFSKATVGAWFVSGGFFVPENEALGRPVVAATQIYWGAHSLSGSALATMATAALFYLLGRALLVRRDAWFALALPLFACASLPWFAFLEGHPFRVRYMVPLIAAEAVAAGALVGASKRAAALAGTVLIALVLFQQRPLDDKAPMLLEAQWDIPNARERQTVTDYLHSRYRGETVMASMGSLGHYMQELSAAGLQIRDFLHEGNGDIWLTALKGPRPFVGWILIEEKAEGGDMLAKIVRENPEFLSGFSRVSEGGGVVLYVRQNRMLNVAR